MKKLVSWFCRIPKPTRRQMGWFAIPTLLAVLAAFLWVPPAQAAFDVIESLETIGNFFGNLFSAPAQLAIDLIVSVLSGLLRLINAFLISLIEWVMHPALRGLFGLSPDGALAIPDAAVNLGTVVFDTWKIILGAANVFFFLALLIFSIMIITRQAGYNFKQAITKLIVVVLLANLSFLIAKVLIFTVGDSLTEMVRVAFDYNITEIGEFFSQTLASLWMGNWSIGSFLHDSPFVRMAQSIFILVIEVVFTFTLFRLGWVLIERAVRLVIATIFAPILFAFSLLPGKELQSLASNWWADIIKWVLVLPFTMTLIAIAMRIQSFMLQDTIDQGFIPTLMNLINNSGEMATRTSLADIILMVLVISLLLAASSVPKMVGVTLSAATAAVAGGPGAALGGAAKEGWKALTKEAGAAVQAGAKDIISKGAEKISPKAYKQITGAVTERKKRREAQAKVREGKAEAAAKEQIAQRSQEINENYDIKLQQIITNHNQGLDNTDPNYWREDNEEQKALAEKELARTNPGLVRDREVAKAQQAEVISQERKSEEDKGISDVKAKEEIIKRIQTVLADRLAGVSDGKHNSKLRGLADHIFREAQKGGPGAVPWKILAHDMLGNPDTEAALIEAGYFKEKIPSQSEFAVSDRDINRYEASRQKIATPQDLKDYANSITNLKKAETTIRSIREELDKLKGDNKSIQLAVDTINRQSDADITSLNQSLLGMERNQVESLATASGDGVTAIEQLLNDTQRNKIREIQTSDGPRDDKVNDLRTYLGSLSEVFDPNETNIVQNISEVLVDSKIDPSRLSTSQIIARGVTQPEGSNIKSYISELTTIQVPRESVNRLETKISAASTATPGFIYAMRSAVGSNLMNDVRIKEVRDTRFEITESFAKTRQEPSVNMSGVVSNKQLENLSQIIKDAGVGAEIKLGSEVSTAADVGNISYDDMQRILRKIESAHQKVTKPLATPSENEAEL